MSPRRSTDELAASLLLLADSDFAGYSTLYASLARSLADDEATLAFIADNVPATARWGRVAVLFLAAMHDAALARPDAELAAVYAGRSGVDPHQALVGLLAAERNRIVATMGRRSVQTNEVTRAAVLRPAVAVAARSAAAGAAESVALVELGPSAGLNLYADHFHIAYHRTGDPPAGGHIAGDHVAGDPIAEAGSASSPVRVHCVLQGPGVPPCGPLPPVAVRTGIDRSPLDVTDPADARWLQACVWPGSPHRAALLASAMDLVAQDPPTLHTGDAVAEVAGVVEALPPGTLPVVVASWVLAYVPSARRDRLMEVLDSLGRQRDLALVVLEEPRFVPWLGVVGDDVPDGCGGGTPTVVGLASWSRGRRTTELLGWSHPHGRWLWWGGGPAR